MSTNCSKFSDASDPDREYLIAKLLDQGNKFDISPPFVAKLQSVFGKLPLDVLEALSDQEPVFFAPSGLLGRVFNSHPPIDKDTPIVYLSAELLSLTEEETEGIIAHELAHLYLRHDDEPSADALADAGELEADKLAGSWGFSLPQDRKEQLAQDRRKLTDGTHKRTENT